MDYVFPRAIRGYGEGLHAGYQETCHPIEDVLLVLDVAVEGHRLNAQGLSEPAHGHSRESLTVGQGNASFQNGRARQRCSVVPGQLSSSLRLRPHCVYIVSMTYSVSNGSRVRMPRSRWFVLSALAGGVHTAITLHWALGGQGLLWTMGDAFIAKFSSMMWVLYPLALVKGVGAFAPLWLQDHAWWPAPRLTRALYWGASGVLLIWGGLNTIVSNLVLFHVIHPADGYDRPVMIGHAWIWDPLFVLWGVGLLLGLRGSRDARASRIARTRRLGPAT